MSDNSNMHDAQMTSPQGKPGARRRRPAPSKVQTAAMKQKARRAKMFKYGYYAIGLLVVLYIIGSITGGARYGSIQYGICRGFLERYVPFPQSIKILKVAEGPEIARILYSHTNTFGQFRLQEMECQFKPDQKLANRDFLKRILEQISVQGGALSHIAKAAGLPEKIIYDYMVGDRDNLPDNGAINRVASRFGVAPPVAIKTLQSITVDKRPLSDQDVIEFRKAIPSLIANPPDLTYPLPLPSNIEDYKQ